MPVKGVTYCIRVNLANTKSRARNIAWLRHSKSGSRHNKSRLATNCRVLLPVIVNGVIDDTIVDLSRVSQGSNAAATVVRTVAEVTNVATDTDDWDDQKPTPRRPAGQGMQKEPHCGVGISCRRVSRNAVCLHSISVKDINPLECRRNYSATSNNKLVHWPLSGGLVYIWYIEKTGRASSLYQMYSPPINGQYTNHRMVRCSAVLMCLLKG